MAGGRGLKGVLILLVVLVAAATAIPLVMAGGGHHHGGGPVNPLLVPVKLYLEADGTLSQAAPGQAGERAAGATVPGQPPAAVAWTTTALYNGKISTSVFADFYVSSDVVNFAVASPENGKHFGLVLARNGAAVEGASTFAAVESGLMQPGERYRVRVFVPATNTEFAKGDTIELWISFYGANPEANPVVKYLVGGETPSSLSWEFAIASLDELGHDHNGFAHFPLIGFPLDDLSTTIPNGVVVNVKAFHWGFTPNPIVVKNGTHVILRVYYEPEADDSEILNGVVGHPEQPDGAVHGFSLETYKKGLSTRLYPGEVVIMEFDAVGVGEYLYFCTVFCGESSDKSRGHSQTMHGQLVIEKSEAEKLLEEQLSKTVLEGAGKNTPGLDAGLLLLAAAGIALFARRRP